ncbi:hypothetical protein [Methanosarcina siciliae]|nr:hypothetical protein [Methanosarcina siciliae]
MLYTASVEKRKIRNGCFSAEDALDIKISPMLKYSEGHSSGDETALQL